MDLNTRVIDSLEKMDSSGEIQEIVDKHVASTVESILKSAFGEWSNFSKNLKEQVESKLDINLQELDLATYNEAIISVVKEKLDDQIATAGVNLINESLENLLASAKDEYKLSELVEELRAEFEGFDDPEYEEVHEMTMHIDDSYSTSAIIYLDSAKGIEKYDCKYSFWVNEKTSKIDTIEIANERRHVKRAVRDFDARAIMRGLKGLEETLFKMYAHGSKLKIDADNVEIEIYGEDSQ